MSKPKMLNESPEQRQAKLLLSGMGSTPESHSPSQGTPSKKESPTAPLVRMWVSKYQMLCRLKYGRISVKELTLLKRLVTDYGKEGAIQMLNYYLENYGSLPYLGQNHRPNISALYGFRHSLYPDSQLGRQPDVRKGNYSGADRVDYSARWNAQHAAS